MIQRLSEPPPINVKIQSDKNANANGANLSPEWAKWLDQMVTQQQMDNHYVMYWMGVI